MVQFKLASILLALALLAVKSVVAEDAHALEVFPELKGEGHLEIAYKDPNTHKIVVEEVDENGQGTIRKRSCRYSFACKELSLTVLPDRVNQDALTKLLKNHNGYGFCKGFCPAYTPRPVTKTSLKTSMKVVQTTTTIAPAPMTVTCTVTGRAPADSTVTQTSTVSTTTTTTFTADPSTIIVSETVSTFRGNSIPIAFDA